MTSTDHDLGPMPDASIEPGEPQPGGVDAIDAIDSGQDADEPASGDDQYPDRRSTSS